MEAQRYWRGWPSHEVQAGRIPLVVWLCWFQGGCFALTGLWPLIDLGSFELVTGGKTDHWLVETVAVLVLGIGATLLCAAWRHRVEMEVALLGGGTAVALAAIDVIYHVKGVIGPVYLVDAAVQVLIVAVWIWMLWAHRLPRAT